MVLYLCHTYGLEDTFNIVMDMSDIIDFSSYNKGIEILVEKYNLDL